MKRKGVPTGLFRRFDSRFDGKPIVVLVSLTPSRNRKTGHMLQVAIVRDDVAPNVAQKTGDDSSVCGNCRYRWFNAKPPYCYVVVSQSVLAQWKAYKAGSYHELHFGRHRPRLRGLIRAGSYGDPAAVPLPFWEELLRDSYGFTGYTHQWRNRENQEYRRFFMASVDSIEEAKLAHLLGWRYFRVRTLEDRPLPGEFTCPASAEAGYRRQCSSCLACNGANGMRSLNPVVTIHGARNGKRSAA